MHCYTGRRIKRSEFVRRGRVLTGKGKKNIVLSFIVFLCAVVFFCGFFATKNTEIADAYNSTNATVPTTNYIGDIVLSDYATRTDGLVFDYTKLNTLYGKLVQAASGTNTTTSDLGTAKTKVHASSSSLTSTASTGNTLTQLHSLDFATMQSRLNNAPITLKFGGYDWTVVYATTNILSGGTTQAGDLIVTLWLNDVISTPSKWSVSTLSADSNTDGYPPDMYSTSYIRVNALNAGGDMGSYACGSGGNTKYTTSNTQLGGTVSLNDCTKTNLQNLRSSIVF